MNSLGTLVVIILVSAIGIYFLLKSANNDSYKEKSKKPVSPKKYDSSKNIIYTKQSPRKDHRKFTSRAEADKAVNSLRGILEGILMDQKVTKGEINELNKWCVHNQGLGHMNPFKDFLHTIQHRILTESDKLDTLEDIYWLSQQYQENNIYYNAVTSDMQTLQGICHGIISDGVIEDLEVIELYGWIEKNKHLSEIYPYAELYKLLSDILDDGVIDDEEIKSIKSFFQEFVELNDKKLMSTIKEDTTGISFSKINPIEIKEPIHGKWVCITGELNKGTKETLYSRVERNGGVRKNNVSNKLNYLIIGGAGSPAWTFASYGRKVEDVISRQKKGHDIKIIKENDFYEYLERTGS